ncbi:SDR family oxidoreductase [Aquicoccus sp. SCR17]|nr:SDR family oxidoreductase [Carideicomes alvinocaridis]
MTDKVAVVTGASRGIGAEIAIRLAADGFAVVVACHTGREAAEAVVTKIAESGGEAVVAQADLGDPAGMSQLFDAAEKAFGGVDVLVNNAGMMALSPVAEVTDDSFERQVSVNLGGVFRGLREAANRLRNGGAVVNFSSSVVGLYQPGYAVYAATKAGVEAMTHVLAKELASRGIRVNTVAPGPVETDLFMHGKSPDLVEKIMQSIPFGRLGQPEEIARVVSFLAGPDSGWVTGQVIRANGGVV